MAVNIERFYRDNFPAFEKELKNGEVVGLVLGVLRKDGHVRRLVSWNETREPLDSVAVITDRINELAREMTQGKCNVMVTEY